MRRGNLLHLGPGGAPCPAPASFQLLLNFNKVTMIASISHQNTDEVGPHLSK